MLLNSFSFFGLFKVKRTPLEINTMKTGKRIADPDALETYQPPKKKGKRPPKSAVAAVAARNREEELPEIESADDVPLPTSVERLSRKKAISQNQASTRPQSGSKTKTVKAVTKHSAGKARETAGKARSAKHQTTAQCGPTHAKQTNACT